MSNIPHLNGLRAIAVFLVFIYHIGVIFHYPLLSGGYLGVDIFIVISGYLMMKIASEKYDNFINFIKRRFERIFFPLIFLIFILIFINFFFLNYDSFIEFNKIIKFVISFSSNLFFYFCELNYNSFETSLNPLLHTWSLSLEFQYYVFFGFLFYCLNIRNFFFYFLIFFIIFVFFINNNYNFKFYLLPTRLTEFFIGVFVYKYKIKIFHLSKNLKQFLIYCSILVISVFILKHDLYPISNGLIIFFSISVGLLIVLLNENKLFLKLLIFKPISYLGKISYSFYLWHYPILLILYDFVIIYQLKGFVIKIYIISLSLILTILFSTISFKFIEKYKWKKVNLKKKIILLTISALVLIAYSFKGNDLKYFNKEFFVYFEKNSWHTLRSNWELFRKKNPPKPFSNDNSKKVLIIGNSKGRDLYNIVIQNKDIFDEYEISYLDLQIACFPINNKILEKCKTLKNQELQKLKQADVIFFASRYRDTKNEYNDLERIQEIIIHYNKSKKIIIGSHQAEFGFQFNFFEIDRVQYLKKFKNDTQVDLNKVDEVNFKQFLTKDYIFNINQKLKKISDRNSLQYIDLINLTCDYKTKTCKSLSPNQIKYFYDEHLTIEGSKFLGQKLKELLIKAL